MNVRVDLQEPIRDGMEVVFKSPCDASNVTGLNVYYPVDGVLESQNFTFADANTNDLGHFDALFAKDAVVKVILDLDTNMAFVQNADTNAYLESRFADLESMIGSGGGGGEVPSSHINDKNNPHKVYAEQIGAAPMSELGDVHALYSVLHLTDTINAGQYIDANYNFIEQENCTIYTLPIFEDVDLEEHRKLRGKTLKIKTYAYGDMSYGLWAASGATNANANIEEDPLSGIWEFEVDIPEDFRGLFRISFCANDYLDAPEIAISQGTVWEEIKALQEFRDNLVDYLPIYNGEVL